MQSLIVDMDRNRPIIIGARGMESITQNIRMILLTLSCSIPLFRAFAHKGQIIDSPAPLEAARQTGEIIKALEKYEPRIKVHKLEWQRADLAQGALAPRITFSLRKGVNINAS